ncbi:hypothetical protein GCM10023322_07590 [Rugosimonospora acidiphila]|uniref:Rhodanese domain-containing protein n=1 Tax=Rugosimonospora acidiphila TaxID=556531 RepID=A0ABP9RKG3_9ACTN
MTRAVRAPAESAWEALTDPRLAGQWWGEVSPEFRVGQLSQLVMGDGDVYALEVLRLDAPHRLEYRRRRFGIDVKETICWDLTPHGDGCLITVGYPEGGTGADRREPEHEEWLRHTDRLERWLVGAPVPPIPPTQEFILSTDLPGDPPAVRSAMAQFLQKAFQLPGDPYSRWFSTTLTLTDGGEPGELRLTLGAAGDLSGPNDLSGIDGAGGSGDERTASDGGQDGIDRGAEPLLVELEHPSWWFPTAAELLLRRQGQGTRLTVRHRGWEGTGADDDARGRQRRRFAQFWHRLFLRFTLQYARSLRIPTLTAVDLSNRMDRPDLFVFDANRTTLWQRGHVPEAVFVGQEDIPVDRLPADRQAQLVFYCRDSMCLTAYLSAAKARTLGYPNTFVMEGGRRAWAESGFPLVSETGESAADWEKPESFEE